MLEVRFLLARVLLESKLGRHLHERITEVIWQDFSQCVTQQSEIPSVLPPTHTHSKLIESLFRKRPRQEELLG